MLESLMRKELDFLELLEKEQPINWSVDFWKLTANAKAEIQEFVDKWKANGRRVEGLKQPDDFINRMIDQIRYYDMHKMKIDGTIPTDIELERIANNGIL